MSTANTGATPAARYATESRQGSPDQGASGYDDVLTATNWEGRTAASWLNEWRQGVGVALPDLRLYERVASTNDIARQLADSGAPTGTVVIANEQTRGRGRAGRPWHAPAGTALLLSLLLRSPGPLSAGDAPGAIPLRIGLAIARALERCTGTRLQLKWPNDLQVEGAKVAGILCEAALTARGGGFVVAGIGLNVNQDEAELPGTKTLDRTMAMYAGAAQPSTSLRLATGCTWDRGLLAGAIIAEVLEAGDRLFAPLSAPELAELAARDPLRGHLLTVDGEVDGMAAGMTPDGALCITGHNGQTTNLRHGTVRIASRNDRTTMD